MSTYFGTDGIRGEADTFLTVELAYKVGYSLSKLSVKQVMIGQDTRESSPRLEQAIKKGALDAGINVLSLGVVPTPVLAYMSQEHQCFGVMITASHNPFQDNGIKIFRYGKKLFLEEEAILEAFLHEELLKNESITPGIVMETLDAFHDYLAIYNSFIRPTLARIVLDFANGATYQYGPKLFTSIAKNAIIVGNQPNGLNINLGVGSTHLETIKNIIIDQKLDYGFAFDGDGDRLLMVDHQGQVVDGDKLIYVIACYLKEKSILQHDTVVLTKMSNLGIIKALKDKGISVVTTDVGDKYVIDALDQADYQLGGENSGHVINRRFINTGDGLLNAAFLISIMEETKQNIQELTKAIQFFPDKLVNIRNINKELVHHPLMKKKVAEIAQLLGENGKILVRASGTEPLVRISCSAPTMEQVDTFISTLVELFNKLISNLEE
jgi:phosphoglucosamine mutase